MAAHATYDDIERKIRAGGYPTYTAACTGISKMKGVTPEQKSALKRTAEECIPVRANPRPRRAALPGPVSVPVPPAPPAASAMRPVWYVPPGADPPAEPPPDSSEDWFRPLDPRKAEEAGLEPDPGDAVPEPALTGELPVLSSRPRYRDMRELREALAQEVARIDAELAAGAEEEAQERFRDRVQQAVRLTVDAAMADWEAVSSASVASASEELASRVRGGSHCLQDFLRLLAVALLHGVPAERPALLPAESAA